MDLPAKRYSIIYADPPWAYKDKAASGKRGASFKYNVEESNWIASLDVRSIANVDCCLFLWATMPLLDQAFDVIEEWGFTYKTVAFVWVKTQKVGRKLFLGMGNWTRANAELCLLAVKGKPKRVSAAVHSVVISPIREHSRKPDEVRDRIVKLCGDVTRIELFSRQATRGWDVWGNQAPQEQRKGLLDSDK